MAIGEATVCVLGLPSVLLNPDILVAYFESTRNGGGLVNKIQIEEQDCRAFITFESVEVAARVLEKRNFTFQDSIIKVVTPESVNPNTDHEAQVTAHGASSAAHGALSAHEPPDSQAENAVANSGDNVVLLENVPLNMDAETLDVLIDNPKKCIDLEGKMEIRVDSQSSSATVTFTNVEDAKKLLKKEFVVHKGATILVKQPAKAYPGAILITGITSQLNEEMLDVYFSNTKKSRGDDIEDFKFCQPDLGFAVIVYKDPAVAARVVDKRCHEVFKHRLIVQPWIPGSERQFLKETDAASTRVSASEDASLIAPSGSTATPVMNASAMPSGEIAPLTKYEPLAGTPIGPSQPERHMSSSDASFFSDSYSEERQVESEDVEMVEDERSSTPRGPYQEPPSKKLRESDEENNDDDQKSCTILVEGISKKSKEDTIKRFFENRTKTGGGKIESLTRREDGSYIIVFEERACVDRVLKREKLTLDNSRLEVKEMTATAIRDRVRGPTEPCMLYIMGDLTKLTKDALELYLEEEAHADVKKVIYGTNEGVVLVQFKKKPDYMNLKQRMQRSPVEGVMLSVSKVPRSSTVQVHSTSNLLCYVLEMYFENEGRSGGGGKVKIEQQSSSVYLAQFNNPATAEAVLKRKHQLDKDVLQVSIYRAELGLIPPDYDTSQPPVKIPTHTIVSNLDPLKVKFLKSTKDAFNMANIYLQKFHAGIVLAHPATDEVKVICKLTPDTENWRNLAETWTKKASSAINEIFDGFEVEKIVCLPKYWKEICAHVTAYKKEREQSMNLVMIVENPENHALHIIGQDDSIANLVKDINKICQDVQESQEQVTDEVKASAAKLEVLEKMDVPTKLKQQFNKINIKVDIKNEKLLMQGSPNDILKAIKQVYDTLNGITEVEVATSNLVVNIVSSTEGWKYVTDMLKANNLVTVIECTKNKLIISGLVDQCQQTEDLLRKEIIENEIPIDEDSRPALQGNEWDAFIQEHTSTHQGRLILQVAKDLSTLTVVTTSDLEDAIKEQIANYLKAHTVKKQQIPVSKACLKLLTNHAQDKIKQIESDFRIYGVKIQPSEQGFVIQGISDGFTHAVTRVKELTVAVVYQSQDIIQPGLPKFLMSPQSSVMIAGIENSCTVAIEILDRAKEEENQRLLETAGSQHQAQILDSVSTEHDVTIKVVVGDLTEHFVDAIVNPANRKLQHYGGLAGALTKKGGCSIQEESEAYIRNNGTLQVGDAIMTKAGSLNCKRIIHTVGPHWNGGVNGEEDLLWDCVYKSLELAQKEAMRSIAFPAIGSGIFGVPIQVSTECIVAAIFDYLRATDDTDIKEIHLVDEDKTRAEEFIKALKDKFGTTLKTQKTRRRSTKVESRDGAYYTRLVLSKSIHYLHLAGRCIIWPTLRFGGNVLSQILYTSGKVTLKAIPMAYRAVSQQGARPKEKAEAPESLSSSNSTGNLVDNYTYVTPGGVTIKIVKGEIAKQQADAIMNSIPGNVNLSSGALSNSIMQSMDAAKKQAVQAEASQKAPNGLKAGDVITTSAGNLASNSIFHIVLPNWTNAATTLQYLENALDKVLTQAHQAGLTSLALPSVGTGNLHWPHDIVAKTMFDAIIKMSQNNPGTSLTAVNLVIYPNDQASVTAFENYMQTLSGRGATGNRTNRKLASSTQTGWQSFEVIEKPVGASGDGLYGAPSKTPVTGEMQIRSVKLQVTTGDITLETTDAIVNSTNPQINLSFGGVSQALAKAGGRDFIEKCKSQGGTRRGLAVTGPGNLQVKFVIHIDNSYFNENWKHMIFKCLQEAERLRLSSVTFPALGTGMMSKRPEDMATCMMEAISDFTKTQPEYLKLVRVVIYQSQMVSAYFSQMEATSKPGTSLWSSFKKLIGIGDGEQQYTSNPSYYTGGPSYNSDMRITLGVCGFTKDKISQALDAIDKLWQDNRADRTLGGNEDPKLKETIKKLSPEETEHIENMGGRKNVKVQVESKRKVASIRIQGYMRDAIDVETAIRKYLHNLEMKEYQQQEAQLLCQFVQWEFEDRPGMFTPYPEDINVKIEKAFSQKEATVSWLEEEEDEGRKTVEVNFKDKTETDLKTKSVCKVRRRDISKQAGALPDNWKPMQPTDRVLRVPLLQTDKEYTDVLTAFNQTASNHTILKIERIQNPSLYRRYAVHKLDMQQEKPGIQAERMIWHGTADDILDKINSNGFNRSYCGQHGVVYGKGVYFARDASYSVGYAPVAVNGECHMYYASVLTGEYAVGNKNMMEPPAKNPSQPNILFDSTVDNIGNPSIFVVYYDTQVYPNYLITFQ